MLRLRNRCPIVPHRGSAKGVLHGISLALPSIRFRISKVPSLLPMQMAWCDGRSRPTSGLSKKLAHAINGMRSPKRTHHSERMRVTGWLMRCRIGRSKVTAIGFRMKIGLGCVVCKMLFYMHLTMVSIAWKIARNVSRKHLNLARN